MATLARGLGRRGAAAAVRASRRPAALERGAERRREPLGRAAASRARWRAPTRRRRQAAGGRSRPHRRDRLRAGLDRGRDLRQRHAPERMLARRAPPRAARRPPRRRSPRSRRRRRAARARCTRACRGRRRRPSACRPRRTGRGRSRGAGSESFGVSSTRTFDGFTSRWTIPRRCACASASSTWAAASTASRSLSRAGAQRLAQRAAVDVLVGDVDVAAVAAEVVGADAALVAEPRRGLHLARRARGALSLARDDLERDLEAGALVAREPDRARAAPPERAEGPVAVEDEIGGGKGVGGARHGHRLLRRGRGPSFRADACRRLTRVPGREQRV